MSVPTGDDSFVFVNIDPHNLSDSDTEMELVPRPPEMKSMNVVSNVRNRYARTVVTSKYNNPDKRAQEATFSIVLPDTAFIAGFVMEIKGKKYEAYVKEKEEAKQEYYAAVSRGQAAAHVAVDARDSNMFTVSVNVEPQSDVTFILTYEELLMRKHSKYEMVVNLHLAQLLDELGVDIYIKETRPIINVETPALRSGSEITDKVSTNKYATIKKDTEGMVHVSFHPTIQEQKEMTNVLNGKGMSGQFVVEYDVQRDPLGGEVLVNDGYFVHFFAPTDLKVIPKHVIFVLDVSGSMGGRKILQLKEAMNVILSELNPEDYFNIIKFNSTVQILYSNNSMQELNNTSLPATAENISKAQKVVQSMIANGGTNISDALITALSLTLKGISNPDKNTNMQPIIVFLTDGQANNGICHPNSIIEIVEKRNEGENKSAIFTLAFGNDANKIFLKELAMKNSGFLRNIYEAADASLQLQEFYKQISSPLLTNVNFKYSEEVKEVTKHKFDILFNGSEFVVTGKVDKAVDGFVIVEGSTLYGIDDYRPTIIPICPTKEDNDKYGNLERLWAYMTIKQLLDQKYEKKTEDKDTTSTETPEKQALKLALKYSFVTPVTSLVVVKPEDNTKDDLQWGPVHVGAFDAFPNKRKYCGGASPGGMMQMQQQIPSNQLRSQRNRSEECSSGVRTRRRAMPCNTGALFGAPQMQQMHRLFEAPQMQQMQQQIPQSPLTLHAKKLFLSEIWDLSAPTQSLPPENHQFAAFGSASAAAIPSSSSTTTFGYSPNQSSSLNFHLTSGSNTSPFQSTQQFGYDTSFGQQSVFSIPQNLSQKLCSKPLEADDSAFKNMIPQPPKLKTMQVVSNVRNRIARTAMTSKYVNQETRALQTTVSFVLPDTASIIGFAVEIMGKKYEANIREKEQAKKEYQEAIVQGLVAAHASRSAEDFKNITIFFNIKPQLEVSIILTYEQLLVRMNNKYELVTNLDLANIVEDLEVDIKINDAKPDTNVDIPILRAKDKIIRTQYSTTKHNEDGSIEINFKPTIEQQNEIINILGESNNNKGISGQFVVEYNITSEDKEDLVNNVPAPVPVTDLVVVVL